MRLGRVLVPPGAADATVEGPADTGALIAMSRALIAALGVVIALQSASAAVAAEPAPVKVVVLLESGVGGARAQAYLDELLALTASACGWPAVASQYTTRKPAAVDYIKSDAPQLGLLSLGAYLALRDAYQLEVIGEALAAAAGGRRYYVVGTSGALADCKGQPFASNHLSDPRFVDQVLFRGATRLADYKLVETPRPVQTLKAVIRGEARCALIDDAQLAQLPSIEGGAIVKTLWQSAELPPMPIVAFPHAQRSLVTSFQKAMPTVCQGKGAETCVNVGLQGLLPSSDARYESLMTAYRGHAIAKP